MSYAGAAASNRACNISRERGGGSLTIGYENCNMCSIKLILENLSSFDQDSGGQCIDDDERYWVIGTKKSILINSSTSNL